MGAGTEAREGLARARELLAVADAEGLCCPGLRADVCGRAGAFAQRLGRAAASWTQQAEELSRLAKGSSWGGGAEQQAPENAREEPPEPPGERAEQEPKDTTPEGRRAEQEPEAGSVQPAEGVQPQEPEVTWGDGVVEIGLPGVRAAEMDLQVSEEEVLLQAGAFALRLRARVDGASAKLRRGVLSLRVRA